MAAFTRNPGPRQGVSIITCTNRPSYIRNLFENYRRQRHVPKELIIIVHNDKAPLTPYLQAAQKHSQVHVFRRSEKLTLGACLNDAVKKTKYPFIAKFDDDDYYAPQYLADCLQAFRRSRADVVGKLSHYMYLRGSRTLLLRFPNDGNRYVSLLPGATLVIKRSVFRKVKFPNRTVGEDDEFCKRSRRKGLRLYSAGRYNFVAIRRKNSSQHTWTIGDRELIAYHRTIPNVSDFRSFVQRKPRGVR